MNLGLRNRHVHREPSLKIQEQGQMCINEREMPKDINDAHSLKEGMKDTGKDSSNNTKLTCIIV